MKKVHPMKIDFTRYLRVWSRLTEDDKDVEPDFFLWHEVIIKVVRARDGEIVCLGMSIVDRKMHKRL